MKDVVSSFTATLLIQGANVGSGVLLARILQPDGRGDLAAVMLWPTIIAALGILGLHEAISYFMARKKYEPKAILRASTILGLCLIAILIPLGFVIANVVFADAPEATRAAAYLYLTFIPLNFAGLFLTGMFQDGLNFLTWNILRSSVHVANLVLIGLFYAAGYGTVWGFALASLLSNGVVVLIGLVLSKKIGWLHRPGPVAHDELGRPSDRIVMTDLMRYGLSIHLGVAIAIVAERLDQLIISLILPSADLGLYVVAGTMARLPLMLASTFAVVAFPKIAAAATREEKAHILGRYMRATVIGVVPASLALAAVTPWLLPLFFGPAFSAATAITWMLIVALVPLSMKSMLSSGLKACDRGFIVGRVELLTLILSAALLSVLIPLAGLMGAALALVIAQLCAASLLLRKGAAELHVPARTLLIPRVSDVSTVWREWRRL